MRIGDWMQTYTGERFWPLDPRIEDIHIRDISMALGKLCRYGGHTIFFYSVAEHSVLVSEYVPEEYALWGLLHDASEAYLSDIVKPLKNGLSNYKELENRIMQMVAEKFKLQYPAPKIIDQIDKQILRDEQLQVMNPCKYDWWCTGNKPLGAEIQGWSPIQAGGKFYKRFTELVILTGDQQ